MSHHRLAHPVRLFKRIASAAPAALIAAHALLAAPPAQAEEIEAGSSVAAALVYSSGATVERRARFVAPAGRHEIVISDLPVALDKDSLRVSGAAQNAFEILGVSHKITKPRVAPLSEPERQKLLDEIEALRWELRAADDAIAEAEARLAYMAAFRAASVGGRPFLAQPRAQGKKGAGDQPRHRGWPGHGGDPSLFEFSSQWPEAWSLIASESAAARQAQRGAQRERDRISKAIDTLRDKLEKVGPPPPARGVLTVSIKASAPIADGTLTISYLTTQARWTPLYDLKLTSEGVEKPGLEGRLSLVRRASVTQRTGEDWSDVRLELSSARPRGRVTTLEPPTVQAMLEPLAPPVAPKARGGLRDEAEAAQGAARIDQLMAPLAAQSTRERNVGLERRLVAAETDAAAAFSGAGVVYKIPEAATIPGDGQARLVRISVEESKVDLVARAAPAQEQSAYLYAIYTSPKAPILPGRASIYRDGVFYGQTRLAQVAPGDETTLPFGRLDEVKITHRVIGRSNKVEGLISSSNKRESRFEFSARNLGKAPRKVTLLGAQPYSETEDVVIRRTGERPTEQDIEGRRGVLSWTFELSAGAEKTIPFGYDIGWPDGRKIRLSQ